MELESELYDWFTTQRSHGFAVSTSNLICKAQQIYPNFKNNCMKRLRGWARKFHMRHQLVFRRPTRVLQYAPQEAEQRRAAFALSTMTLINMSSVSENLFLNMDESAVYFENQNEKCEKTVSVRYGSSSDKRCTVCIAFAADGTKLPLFVIFKGSINGPIANSLQQIMPDGMPGCTQRKAWMDYRVMEL